MSGPVQGRALGSALCLEDGVEQAASSGRVSHPDTAKDQALHTHTHISQAFHRGRAGGSPRAAVSVSALRPGPDHALLGQPGAYGSTQATRGGLPCPCQPGRWGFRHDTPVGRHLPGAFKASGAPRGSFPDAGGQVRQGAGQGVAHRGCSPTNPSTPRPGGAAEAWRGPGLQPAAPTSCRPGPSCCPPA